ncbi:hypothetical protein BDF14DRAFT_1788338 [Spinellus fusiger]|nr:hypothetical protein BDF14DRAFT_1788338 [Spinellus fusiger]
MINASCDDVSHTSSASCSEGEQRPNRLRRFSRWTQSLFMGKLRKKPREEEGSRRHSIHTQERDGGTHLRPLTFHVDSGTTTTSPSSSTTTTTEQRHNSKGDRTLSTDKPFLAPLSLSPPPRRTTSKKSRVQSMQWNGDTSNTYAHQQHYSHHTHHHAHHHHHQHQQQQHPTVLIQRPRTMTARPFVLRLSLDVEQHSTFSRASTLSNDSDVRYEDPSSLPSSSMPRSALLTRDTDLMAPLRSGTLGTIRPVSLFSDPSTPYDSVAMKDAYFSSSPTSSHHRLSLIERRRRRSPLQIPGDGSLLLALSSEPVETVETADPPAWTMESPPTGPCSSSNPSSTTAATATATEMAWSHDLPMSFTSTFDRDVGRHEAMLALEGKSKTSPCFNVTVNEPTVKEQQHPQSSSHGGDLQCHNYKSHPTESHPTTHKHSGLDIIPEHTLDAVTPPLSAHHTKAQTPSLVYFPSSPSSMGSSVTADPTVRMVPMPL